MANFTINLTETYDDKIKIDITSDYISSMIITCYRTDFNLNSYFG